MDNFKRSKPNKASGIDGFLPRSKSGHSPKRLSFNRSYQPMLEEQTGTREEAFDFKRKDGFYATKNDSIQMTHTAQNTILPMPSAKLFEEIDQEQQVSKKKKRKRSIFKIIKRTLLFTIILAIIGAGILVGKVYWLNSKFFKGGASHAAALDKNVDPNLLKHEGDGRVNILLAATSEDDGADHGGANLTDSIMIISIDPQTKQAALVSLPRDLWVKYGEACSSGYEGKINAVYPCGEELSFKESGYAKGGMGLLEKVIYDTVGIPTHYYAKVGYKAFKQVVDAVDGIDVVLDNAIYDPNFDWQYGKNALKLPKGTNHLNGTKALLLARSRNANGGYGTGTDFARTENQRKMLLALKQKATSSGVITNPVKVYQILDSIGNNITTDIGSGDRDALYGVLKDIDVNAIQSVGIDKSGDKYLLTSDFISGISIVRPVDGLYNFSSIRKYLHIQLKDGLIANENAKILVLNGTDIAGLATKKGDELSSFGYNIIGVDGAPTKDYKNTIIVDLTKGNKKYTSSYLRQRFKLNSLLTTLPSNNISTLGADFVIILGSNEQSNL